MNGSMSRFLSAPPDTYFDELARLLFGDLFFAKALARDLGVKPRTVERWASGHRGMPPYVWPVIARMLRQKAMLLGRRAIDLEELIRREDYPQRERENFPDISPMMEDWHGR